MPASLKVAFLPVITCRHRGLQLETMSLLKTKTHILFAFDVAQSIKLNDVEQIFNQNVTRGSLIPNQRSPRYYGFSTAPLRIKLGKTFLRIASEEKEVSIDAVLYDFGAITIEFSFSMECSLAFIQNVSEELYENESYAKQARSELIRVVEKINNSLVKKHISIFEEDYHIFQIEGLGDKSQRDKFLAENYDILASILRGDKTGLSTQEKEDALSKHLSYRDDDILLLDWHAALFLNYSGEDAKQVLEFANVALLEMRFLDNQLDQALDSSYELIHRGLGGFLGANLFKIGSIEKSLEKIGEHQVDAALLYESVNNSFKLLGDQYLTKVYKLVTERFSLNEWQKSIEKKIETLQSIYEKVNDQISHKRMEAMEIAIIVLFVVSIGLEVLGLLE